MGQRPPRRALILGIACTGLFMTGVDSTALNLALPAVQRSLGTTLADLQWVVSAYPLVLAGLLVMAGTLADRFGRRRVFQLGQVVFTLSSLLCALAPDVRFLVLFRVLQAVGGSMLNPVGNAIVRETFPDARERARAFGVIGAMAGLSMALGPVIGGALVAAGSWRLVFAVNAPVGIAAAVLTGLFVPRTVPAVPRRLDPVGQVLGMAALLGFTFALIEGGQAGFGAGSVRATSALAVGCAVLLVRYELRREQPVLEVRLFGRPPFAAAMAIALSSSVVSAGLVFVSSIYLQEGRGLAPVDAALHLLPVALAMLVITPVSGRLTGRWGPVVPIAAGGAALALGGALLTGLGPSTAQLELVVAFGVLGSGLGLLNPPITDAAVSLLPVEQAGLAASLTTTSRQVGTTVGIAIFGAVLSRGGAAASVASSSVATSSIATSSHRVWWAITGIGLAVLLLAPVTGSGPVRSSRTRTDDVDAALAAARGSGRG